MGRIVVQEFLTLDGVMQAPGGSDEDLEGGFAHGGWSMDWDAEHGDDEGGALIGEWESRTEALLLGRVTYQIWEGAWGVWPEDAPGFEGELTRRYNRVTKHVASSTLTDSDLSWKNSELLGPDLAAAVAELKARPPQQPDGEIRVWGSSGLIRSLAEHDLVDEYRLMIYPIVLGTGKRLFPEGFPSTTLERVEVRPFASGVTLHVLRRERG